MSPGEKPTGSMRIRAVMAAGALSAAMVAGALVTASPAIAAPAATPKPTASATPKPTASATPPPVPRPVNLALAVDLAPGTVLTLPAKDGLRDSATLRVLSGKGGTVDVDAVRGRKTVHLASRAALRSTKQGWVRTFTVKVGALKAGSWRIHVQRSAMHGVWAWSAGPIRVGTGDAVHVGVRPAVRTLYPLKDGTLDSTKVTVTAKDETGSLVPVTGSIRIDSGRKHVTRKLPRTDVVTLPVTALPLGAATVKATVTSPSGDTAVRTTGLTLAPTGVGTSRIVRSSSTVQPVHDGFLDSVVLTTTAAASAGSKAPVSGTLTISRGKTIAAIYPVKSGAQRSFTWDGRVNAVVVPGVYTVTLAMKGPQGLVRTKTAKLTVSKDHLPYAVRDMFSVGAGNQQGLAVRNNMFYVGYDIGNDQSRIDMYDGSGQLMSSLGPLPISHVAELAYSTTTDKLYAATGGAHTPTKVFVLDPTDPQWSAQPQTDPAAVIRATYDFSASLGNNAMVAVDDVGSRLLVFSGSTGAYSVSSVSLTDSADKAADGTTPLVPAGSITATAGVTISGVPQGMDLVGQQLWIYTSTSKYNLVAKYDLASNALLTAAASTSSKLYWGGEGEGMATVAASDTNDGLPAWIFVGAHSALKGGPNMLGQLVPVTDAD